MNLQSHFENFKIKSSQEVDGYLFDEGIKYTNLKSLFEEDFDLIRKIPDSLVQNESLKQQGIHTQILKLNLASNKPQEYFARLSQDLTDETLEITIDKDFKLARPIEINMATESGHCSAPNIKIKVGESSAVQIYVSELSPNNSLTVPNITFEIGRFAAVEFLLLQDQDLGSYCFSNSTFYLSEGSSLKSLSISIGAKLSRHHLNIIHSGVNSSSSAKGIYLSAEGQQMDHYTNIEHMVGSCSSTQHYKGILGAKSKGVFNGRVVIRPNATKASSDQLNNNLILDSSAEIDSKPELEIFNDDVKATHGSTVGQLNPDELFYLQSRGISKSKAIELLSLGFVAELLSDISDDSIKTRVHRSLESKLKLITKSQDVFKDSLT
jgi:Fe-S cluster assembly protein SufD